MCVDLWRVKRSWNQGCCGLVNVNGRSMVFEYPDACLPLHALPIHVEVSAYDRYATIASWG